MSSKMNYEKFRYGRGQQRNGGSSIVSSNYHYDKKIDEDMQLYNARMAGIYRNLPQYRKELAAHKTGVKVRAIALKKHGREKAERLEAERRMEEAVRKVVEILQFHMNPLVDTRQIGNARLVNQIEIHNVLVRLRTKCGVEFADSPEYDHHIKLDASKARSDEQKLDDLRSNREQQRISRLRHIREITERLKARPKTGAING